jgi:hypothetical protein
MNKRNPDDERAAQPVEDEPTILLCGRRVPANDYETLKALVGAISGDSSPNTPAHKVKAEAVLFAMRMLSEWRAKGL